jgi:hypothetical protein
VPPRALAGNVRRRPGVHRSVVHAGSLPEGRGAERARPSTDFACYDVKRGRRGERAGGLVDELER